MGDKRQPRFVAPPGWPLPPPGWTPPPGWQPDPSWPPAPPGHQFWRTGPKYSWRQRVGIAAVVGVVGVAALAAGGWALDEYGDPIHGANACNDDWGSGNGYIQDALIDRLPKGTLRSYMATGADCDDRRTGSVAAAWSDQAHPAAVVDLLVRQGWARTDPSGGPPTWYLRDAPAGDPVGTCLIRDAGAWQQPSDRDEYATSFCSQPSTEQIVLSAAHGPRIFIARFGPHGVTVDAAHKRDKSGVAEIRAGALMDES